MSHYDLSDEEDIDVHVRRYQRAPSPHYVERPRGYYQAGPAYLAPSRSGGTMITTHSRSRSRERRSSPPRQQQMAPVVIENKIINEHSSDSDSDHHRRRHRHSSLALREDSMALEMTRRDLEDLRLREDRDREARRAVREARDNAELLRAKAELDDIKRENDRRDAEKRVKREMELRQLEEEKRSHEEKERRKKEAEEAVERYKLKEAERQAKEKEEKERAEKEYKARVTQDLLAAGVDEKEIVAILEKKKLKKEEKEKEVARPTYTRMSLRHLDIETLIFYKIEFEYDPEPGYILIKRWVPEWEQDMLWEHTRKIRIVEKKKTKEEKLVLAIEDKKHHHHHAKTLGEPEFEWVRKKERRRSKSPGLLMYLAGAKPA